MKKRHGLGMAAMSFLSGAAMITAGSYAIFTADAQTPFQKMQAGTLQIQSSIEDPTACASYVPTDNKGQTSQSLTIHPGVGNDKNGKDTETLLIENTGSLNAWVGLINKFAPDSSDYDVSYKIQVYKPNPKAADQSDPDANGDVHSNCHTGSKYRGAGGEDRTSNKGNNDNDGDNPTPFGDAIASETFSSSQTNPQTPFELPVGDYALVTYTFSLHSGVKPKDTVTESLNVSVEAVQYRNHAKPGPNESLTDWRTQAN